MPGMEMRRLALGAALALSGCGGLGGQPPASLPMVRGADGREYLLLDRGAYKAFYDTRGRLERIEYDSNADGRPDQIARHDGSKLPRTIEIDEDFDGRVDRFESYDGEGRLLKVGMSRRQGAADVWSVLGPGGEAVKREYDDDGDGRVERAEILQAGRVARIEVDGDRDGRIDRWQDWSSGRLASEELDTDRDGRADRRLLYLPDGTLQGVEPLR